MKTRISLLIIVLLSMLFASAGQTSVAADGKQDSEPIKLVAALKAAGSSGGALGVARVFFKQGKSPYQRLQVVAVGLKPGAVYQLSINGITLGSRLSDQFGTVEFLYSTRAKDRSIEDAIELPKEINPITSVKNVSISDANQVIVLNGSLSGDSSGGGQLQQELGLCNNLSMRSGETITIRVPVIDPNGDDVTLAVSCDRGNFVAVSGLSLIIAPKDTDIGTSVCSVTATDEFGLSANITVFLVEVGPPNKPPVITQIPDQTLKAGEVRDIPISATDPDGDLLRLSIVGAPPFVILSDNGNGKGTLRLAPLQTDTQGGRITVQATDPLGLFAQTSFTVTVQKAVVITGVSRGRPNLFINGFGFGPGGARVTINNVDVSARIVGQSDTSITLKGGKQKLNLKNGPNQIQVAAGGIVSNTFVLSLLDE